MEYILRGATELASDPVFGSFIFALSLIRSLNSKLLTEELDMDMKFVNWFHANLSSAGKWHHPALTILHVLPANS